MIPRLTVAHVRLRNKADRRQVGLLQQQLMFYLSCEDDALYAAARRRIEFFVSARISTKSHRLKLRLELDI